MKIRDTKANKIFMLIVLIFFSIIFLDAKFSKREISEASVDINKDINIESISANINIWVKNDIDKAQVKYSTKSNGSLKVENGINSVSFEEKKDNSIFNISFNNEESIISLYLPSNYQGNIKLKSISGNIEAFNNIDLNSLEISTTSGKLNLLDVKTKDNFKIKTLSGDINIENIEANTIKFASTSGKIECYNINSNLINIANISGEIYLESLKADELNIAVTSSDVELDYIDISKEINIATVSGDIDLILDKKDYAYSAQTINGIISIDKNEYEKSFTTNKGLPIKLKTVSGEININTK